MFDWSGLQMALQKEERDWILFLQLRPGSKLILVWHCMLSNILHQMPPCLSSIFFHSWVINGNDSWSWVDCSIAVWQCLLCSLCLFRGEFCLCLDGVLLLVTANCIQLSAQFLPVSSLILSLGQILVTNPPFMRLLDHDHATDTCSDHGEIRLLLPYKSVLYQFYFQTFPTSLMVI